jgi:hypothetical protein
MNMLESQIPVPPLDMAMPPAHGAMLVSNSSFWRES